MFHSKHPAARLHAIARSMPSHYMTRMPAASPARIPPDWLQCTASSMCPYVHVCVCHDVSCRAISGGGVYVSDKPGEHDAMLLRQLVLPDGSLLRCAGPGRPTRDCLFDDVLRDGKSALKVWNCNKGGPGAGPESRVLNGVVAVFNLQGASWDRTKRKFFVHDSKPGMVEAQVSIGHAAR